MEKIFIPLYHFLNKRKWLMYTLLVISSVTFIYNGLKVEYEENIAKLLPQTEAATESGLAFGNLRVKDKIFIQLSLKEDTLDETNLLEESAILASATDELVEKLLIRDTATQYIAHILNRIDDDLLINGLDFALMNVPSFIDEDCYKGFDSLLMPQTIEKQMALNATLVMNDEEGSVSTMVGQDPAALRLALLPQGKSLSGGLGGYTMIDGQLFAPDSTVALAFLSPN